MKMRLRTLAGVAGAALASLALLASTAQAATPAPPYEDFAGCPSPAENEFVASCLKFTFTGGHISLGKREVPIANAFVLRGASEQASGDWLQNSEGGITPVQQPVPGGLIGMTGLKWLDNLSEEALKLYATVELAGQPGSILDPALNVPIKVHFENPVLGKACYVGSNENPIELNLTTGTTSPPAPNEPITGQPTGPLTREAERPSVRTATGGIFVDNAYAAPGANGCQLEVGPYHVSINNLVDAAYGLPAAAGTNATVLDFNRSVVSPKVVYP